MKIEELFEAVGGAIKFAPSNQADEHWALFVGSKKILTTMIGWGGSGLASWDKMPKPITDKNAIALLTSKGVPNAKAFVAFYKKSADLFMNQPSKLATVLNKAADGTMYSFTENGKTFTLSRKKAKA